MAEIRRPCNPVFILSLSKDGLVEG